jgi:hypothetical protein|tara:strand:- start:889 stop:1548 length:660 start_codon:yes stop_codon:yes gene_type:complete
MADFTYLVADIINTSENSATDFISQVPRFVNKAESRMTRDLDDYGLVTFSSIAVSVSNPLVSLPSGTRIVKQFNVMVSGEKINLLQRTDEFINDYWPYVSASVGTPKYYARRTDSSVLIAPTPISTLDGEVAHVNRPTTLSSVAPNNYFSDFCYDALFYASMIEASFFMKSFSDIQAWQSEYTAAIDGLRNQARRTRQDDMNTPYSPVGADNPLIKGSN